MKNSQRFARTLVPLTTIYFSFICSYPQLLHASQCLLLMQQQKYLKLKIRWKSLYHINSEDFHCELFQTNYSYPIEWFSGGVWVYRSLFRCSELSYDYRLFTKGNSPKINLLYLSRILQTEYYQFSHYMLRCAASFLNI